MLAFLIAEWALVGLLILYCPAPMRGNTMDDEPTEASLKDEFPDWVIGAGSNPGLRHARRWKSSPPVVVRGEDWRDLRDEIVRAEARLEQGEYWRREMEGR